ncbi:MAG: serine hydrolase [Clostridia bacterium]|nr:serine hydrolase [Clostridia bacterium]
MFEKITPEQAGISSERVADYISVLERRGLATHSLLMMKGDKIFAEYYWAPFNKDFCHRMYSQTKSYVAIAIGLLEEDGLIDLDKPMVSYFPEKADGELHPFRAQQTVREMLTMQTPASCPNWFESSDPDRTHLYINNVSSMSLRPRNTTWAYDSAGSQVMASLVEKLSGKSLFDFLYERIFKELGTFNTATILKTRNGDAWGDSALVCTSRDMASFARFVMNYGKWNGKQLLNEAYLRKATSALVSNDETAWPNCFRHGYGYQIWRTEQDGFAFVGMGDQLTIMHPATDTVFVITSDNQGFAPARETIVNTFFDYIITPMKNEPLAPNAEAEKRLANETSDLKLKHEKGLAYHENAEKYNGKVVTCATKNNMGISKFSLHFEGDRGELRYTNEQGDKVLPFGICHNVFCKFPELGYSNEFGGIHDVTSPFKYDAAVSASWRGDGKLMINCQIIDRYFGNFSAVVAFNDDYVVLSMSKTAEDFLGKYQGRTYGTVEK